MLFPSSFSSFLFFYRYLPAYNVYRHIQDFCHFQNRINMVSDRSCHMMCWSRLTPSVAELSCPNRETCSHIGIAKGKDRTILIDTLCSNKFKVTVFILRNSKICNISDRRIKLRQISAARLAMKTSTIFMDGFFACEISASPDPEWPIIQISSLKSIEYISES